ncbi:MAG: diacylglycerol/lipid kinase family protein [Terriglobia bacterium]
MKPATLIYNPVAGRNPSRREQEIHEAVEILRSTGINPKPARTTGPGSATELARAAIAGGDELIIACGGDGTVNEVVNGMALAQAALAILPGGTANIVANELSLPHGPTRAAPELFKWQPRRIALGLARDFSPAWGALAGNACRYFLSVAGAGFDAYVIRKLTFDFKMALGVAAYVLEGMRQALHYSFPSLVCSTDGREIKATFALIQRTSLYAGWFRTAPRQSITNSHFSLSLYPERGLRYFLYALAIMTEVQLRDVERMEARQLTLAPEKPGPPVYFELDGELAGMLPATFEVIPDALTLLMPSRL